MIGKRATLDGKYFIQTVNSPVGQIFTRGRVIGQLSELIPVWMVELYPHSLSATDDRPLPNVETAVPIDQLLGVHFYDDQALFEEAWRDVLVNREKRKQRKAEEIAALAAERAKTRGAMATTAITPATLQEPVDWSASPPAPPAPPGHIVIPMSDFERLLQAIGLVPVPPELLAEADDAEEDADDDEDAPA